MYNKIKNITQKKILTNKNISSDQKNKNKLRFSKILIAKVILKFSKILNCFELS